MLITSPCRRPAKPKRRWSQRSTGVLTSPNSRTSTQSFPNSYLVSISNAQRRPLPHARWLGTVYNGIPLSHFTFRKRPGTYLAFLGRISPEKGIDRAIEIAKAVDMPLHIAGPVEREYFTAKIKP